MTQFVLGTHLSQLKTIRAAVVPYIIRPDKNGHDSLDFLFARDKKTGEITDFGGGVKQYEFSLNAGLREFREESDEIFGTLYDKINDYGLSIALVYNRMSVLFIPLSSEWYDIVPTMFQEKRKSYNSKTRKRSHDEVSELLWINEAEFKKMISPHNHKMWEVVRKFYHHSYNNDVRQALIVAYTF